MVRRSPASRGGSRLLASRASGHDSATRTREQFAAGGAGLAQPGGCGSAPAPRYAPMAVDIVHALGVAWPGPVGKDTPWTLRLVRISPSVTTLKS
jgi:hypothetical protein